MVKQNFLTKMLLLCALVVGSVSASRADVIESNFTDKDASVGEGELEWTATNTSSFETSSSARGVQSIKNQTAMVFTSDPTQTATLGTITKVVVTASSNGTGRTMSVTVGGNSFDDDQTVLNGSSNANTEYTFEGSASGTIVVSINPISSNSTCWIKKIEVTYTSSSNPAAVTTVTIDDSGINTNLYVGTNAGTLSATVTAGGNAISGATVSWSSSNTDVATIASDGAVTLVAAGTTTITASYAGVANQYQPSSATYELNVINRNPSLSTLWEEDFSNFNTGGTYSYVLTNGSTNTKIYNEQLAGGTSPELLVSKGGGKFQATIPLESVSGDLTLTFKTNNGNIAVSSTTTGVSISGNVNSGESELTISGVTIDTQNLVLVFTNSTSSNCRLDDILLLGSQVTDTRIDIATINSISPLSVNIGEDGTFTYDITFAEGTTSSDCIVSWESSDDNVLLVDSENGEYIAGDNSGEVSVIVTVTPNDLTLYKAVTKTFAVSVVNPNAADGSIDKPYTVADVIALNPTSTSEAVKSNVYVKGFIIGAVDGSSGALKTVDESNEIDTNIAIADSPTETTNYCTVQLPSGDIRNALKTKNQTYNIGVAQVLVKGNIKKYCNKPGVRDVSEGSKIAEQVNISGAGMATYYTDCALDFTEFADMYAYTATAKGTNITYTRVKKVPAETAVLLRNPSKAAATQLVPVITEGAETVSSNYLVGTLTDIPSLATNAGNGGKNYILNNGSNGVGFYLANNQQVGVHRAYLNVPAEMVEAPFFGLNFDDETTGIQNIERTINDNQYYTLDGRRVAQPTKGLYIVNGKKVVIK